MRSDRRDFLVEIGTEELPPKALCALAAAFGAALAAGLDKAALAHRGLRAFATPRRLAVRVSALAARQPQQRIERRGPPASAAFDAAGQPTRAALAFAASCGIPVGALTQRAEPKGTFLFHEGVKPGATASELLPAIVASALDALPIPRRMRWGSGEAQFVRPVHWSVMLYGREVVPATLLGTAAGNLTHGHRFHAPRPLTLSSPAAYERVLESRGYVVADFATRRSLVRERVAAVAASLGGKPLMSAALLDEVTALTEWPVPLAGRFEERFLALPREVLISTLEGHQRCFPVQGPNGGLMPCFVAVANIESRQPSKIVEGNERVVRPRLADAAFFWEQDRKIPLRGRISSLDAVTFQARLGSLGDKARRVRRLAAEIAAVLGIEADPVVRAAEIGKCDLLTAMVGEFPELQGIMGEHYALADGEPREVALAIREHHLPRAAGDALPQSDGGTVLALADKLDTLAGIFTLGERPSGAKDPFGLRRAAIGLNRILIEKRIELDLARFSVRAVQLARADVERRRDAPRPQPSPAVPGDAARVAAEVYDYVLERLRSYYLEGEGQAAAPGGIPITAEMFEAVLATRPVSPLDFDARLKALSAFLRLPEAASLSAANKRVANILRKSGEAAPATVEPQRLVEPAERRLFEAMSALRESVSAATAAGEYASALARLAELKPAVDEFFERVRVMDENRLQRANRLALLGQMRELFAGVADLSRLPG